MFAKVWNLVQQINFMLHLMIEGHLLDSLSQIPNTAFKLWNSIQNTGDLRPNRGSPPTPWPHRPWSRPLLPTPLQVSPISVPYRSNLPLFCIRGGADDDIGSGVTNQHDKKTFLGLFRAFSSAQPADSENELLEVICPSPLSPGCNSYSLLLDSQKSFAFQEIWLSWNRITKVAKVMYFRVKANKITKVMYFRVKAGVNFNPGAPWDLPPRRLPIQPRV